MWPKANKASKKEVIGLTKLNNDIIYKLKFAWLIFTKNFQIHIVIVSKSYYTNTNVLSN